MERLKCAIREAGEGDRGQLVLLAEETLMPLAENAGHPERYHTTEVIDLLARAEVFVAEVQSELAGFVAIEGGKDELIVRCICVHPAFEARGVANQLLDWAEGFAVDRGLKRLSAHVPAADAPSLHLYRGHGFVVAAIDEESEAPGDEALTLEKPLPEGA